MKLCSRCNVSKEESEYRMRFEKRGRGSKKFSYINNTCRKCDSEISNKYYFAHKDNIEWKEKWRKKSREYYDKNREFIAEKMKIKRQTPEYKEMMRCYRQKNKIKIFNQEVITKKRYQEKHKNNLTDIYIIDKLNGNLGISKEELKQMPELIEAKRAQLKLLRSLQN